MSTNRKKYNEDLVRCTKIGEVLNQRTIEFWGSDVWESKQKMVEVFAELIHKKHCTALYCINHYCDGMIPAQISSASHIALNKKAKEHLNRVSIFCQLLGIEEDNEIVKIMKEVNPQFQYPILKRKNYRCAIEVDFHNKGLSLTREQINHLEVLAISYAIKNKSEK